MFIHSLIIRGFLAPSQAVRGAMRQGECFQKLLVQCSVAVLLAQRIVHCWPLPSDLVGLGWGLRNCLSKERPHDADRRCCLQIIL